MIRRILSYVVLSLICLSFIEVRAQEVQGPIGGFRPAVKSATFKTEGKGKFIYLIDTLSLPFIDDFSSNKIKQFDAVSTDFGLIDSMRYDFLVDGQLVDTLIHSSNPTYQLNVTVVNDSLAIDSTQRSSYEISWKEGDDYSDLSAFFGITSTTTVYDPYPVLIYAGDTTILMSDTTIYGGADSLFIDVDAQTLILDSTQFYLVPDDNTLWMPSGVKVNRTYGVNPPTIGVATFDGVNAVGHPYDFPGADLQGKADTLWSKPIDLSSATADSVFLSFYFQPEGLGEAPDAEDSLSLEFYNPSDGLWKWAWSAEGAELAEFEYVELFVSEQFRQSAFEFRFVNYATLSGSFDHWNLDYVYLDAKRKTNDTLWDDLAIQYMGTSLLNEYQSVPWSHYLEDPAFFMADTFGIGIVNFSGSDVNAPNIYTVYDTAGLSVFTSNPSQNNITQFKSRTSLDLSHAVANSPSEFSFPSNAGTEADYTITAQMGHTVKDDLPGNHQVSFNQHFSSYYAYDDGSAESTYGLDGENAKLAVEFFSATPDTLRNILIHFPILIDTLIDHTFKLTVWSGNLLSEPIYQRTTAHRPVYDELDQFIGYPIDDTIVVSGTFYIGFEQLNEEIMYIGFDRNNDHQDKVYYSVDEDIWYGSSFKGVPMIRPNFGSWERVLAVPELSDNQMPQIQVYPQPASDFIQVEPWGLGGTARLYDLQGRLLLESTQHIIKVDNLTNGLYILQYSENGLIQSSTQIAIVH